MSDQARAGAATRVWEPYVWELSSWLGYALAVPGLLALNSGLSRAAIRPVVRVLGLVAFSVVFCAVHVAVMLGARTLVYRLLGYAYEIANVAGQFVYEYPKDLVPYLLILGMAFLWRRTLASPRNVPPSPPVFLVREGSSEVRAAAGDIDWLEAQGNYVALHLGDRTHLVRRTLADVEVLLREWGFMRTHRSALVRIAGVRGIRTSEDGSLRVLLANGRQAPLSKGRKRALKAALTG